MNLIFKMNATGSWVNLLWIGLGFLDFTPTTWTLFWNFEWTVYALTVYASFLRIHCHALNKIAFLLFQRSENWWSKNTQFDIHSCESMLLPIMNSPLYSLLHTWSRRCTCLNQYVSLNKCDYLKQHISQRSVLKKQNTDLVSQPFLRKNQISWVLSLVNQTRVTSLQ